MFTHDVAMNHLKADSAPELAGITDVEASHRTEYQESLKSPLNVVVGFPMVGTFELSNSTFHMIGAKAA